MATINRVGGKRMEIRDISHHAGLWALGVE
jgi:hypothetical protein